MPTPKPTPTREKSKAIRKDPRKIDIPIPPPFEDSSTATQEYSEILKGYEQAMVQFNIYTNENSNSKEKTSARRAIKAYEV